MRRTILLGEPGHWEVEITGGPDYVNWIATKLGLYVKGGASKAGGASTSQQGSEPSAGLFGNLTSDYAPDEPTEPESARAPEATDSDDELSIDAYYRSFLGNRLPSTLSPEDMVILFGYYLEEHMAKETWSALDVTTCFMLAGLEQPPNMIGILSRLARVKGSIEARGPGDYGLTARSRQMVKAVMA